MVNLTQYPIHTCTVWDSQYLLDCLHDNGTGPDRTYHAHQFIFSFTF